ncbi:MAG: hypothetical protein R6V02_07260, partial [Candidatus Aminicenantes bacterium]
MRTHRHCIVGLLLVVMAGLLGCTRAPRVEPLRLALRVDVNQAHQLANVLEAWRAQARIESEAIDIVLS